MTDGPPNAEFADYRLSQTPVTPTISGQTAGRTRSRARCVVYQLGGPAGLRLDLRDAFWDTGERDVAVLDRCDAPQRFDRLRSGLRLTVERVDDDLLLVTLRQARLRDDDWSNLFGASMNELNMAAGVDVDETLRRAGAAAVGDRRRLLPQEEVRRTSLCALFPIDADLVPVVAYALTRVAPIQNRFYA